ncbi:MAG: hypothetical protein LBP79_06285 [Clostridiales bacterium]|jgi:hypothetical protein|nr:hypothetical protein [Clostridiales bacterium]
MELTNNTARRTVKYGADDNAARQRVSDTYADGGAERQAVKCCGAGDAARHLMKVHAGGNVTVCHAGGAAGDYASALIRTLARAGCVITERRVTGGFCGGTADALLPIDAIRLIIGVGGEEFGEILAAVAFEKSVKSAYIPTVKRYAEAPADYAVFYYDDGFLRRRLAAFGAVIEDGSLTDKAGEKERVSALGFGLARVLGRFERIFSRLAGEGVLYTGDYERALRMLDADCAEASDNISGLYSVDGVNGSLNCAVGEKSGNGSDGVINGGYCEAARPSSAVYASLLYNKKNPAVTTGEAAFIISYITVKLYKLYLECGAVDLSVPKNYNLWTETLANGFGADAVRLLRDLECSDADYFRRAHIANEYKPELRGLIGELDAKLSTLLKKFKRTYADAGYFVKDAVKGGEIIRCIALAAPLSAENTLLKHMDERGILDRFL